MHHISDSTSIIGFRDCASIHRGFFGPHFVSAPRPPLRASRNSGTPAFHSTRNSTRNSARNSAPQAPRQPSFTVITTTERLERSSTRGLRPTSTYRRALAVAIILGTLAMLVPPPPTALANTASNTTSTAAAATPGQPLGQPPVGLEITAISGPMGLIDLAFPAANTPRTLTATFTRTPDAAVTLAATIPPNFNRWRVGVPAELAKGPAAAGVLGNAQPWQASITLASPDAAAALTWTGSTAPAETDRTPDWAKGLVWYQVFPERFANGEPLNDPQPSATSGGTFLKAWQDPWERLDIDELEAARLDAAAGAPGSGRGGRALAPRTAREAFTSVVFRRRYGGDLQGVAQRLDHLQALGVTGLYLTPVFRASSLHKYDAADFRHIDEHFAGTTPLPAAAANVPPHTTGDPLKPQTWNWTPADLYVRDQFIPAVHARGLRIIFDGVWNHVGRNHFAFSDVYQRGLESPFANWLDARFAPPLDQRGTPDADPLASIAPGTLISWKGWDRTNGNLPAFRQVRVDPARHLPVQESRHGRQRPESAPTPKQTDLAPGPKQHVFDVTTRWMKPHQSLAGPAASDPSPYPAGIDGWRLDVAPDVGLPFWHDWRAHVKALNPEALLVGEIWFPAWDYFHGVAFDSQMNYPFARAVVGFLQARPLFDARRLVERLDELYINHPATELVQMNLLTSHDTDRLSSLLWNSPSDYDSSGQLGPTSQYQTTRPPADVQRSVELAVALQATLPGAPMIYYGEEWGMYGADDPHSRKPVPWPDLEATLGPRADPAERADESVRQGFARWFTLRQDARVGPALRLGALVSPHAPTNHILVFDRVLGDTIVRVAVNRGPGSFQIQLPEQATLVASAGEQLAPAAGTGPSARQLPARGARAWTWTVTPNP